MSVIDTSAIAARLDARAEELGTTLTALGRAGGPAPDPTELSGVDNHPAERGTELHDRELDETTLMMLAEELERIGEARRALALGAYGACTGCGRESEAGRLWAMPEAVRCLDCQRHFEGRHRQRAL